MNISHIRTKISFTLLELLVVVAIIAILAALTMGIYGSVKRKGVESRLKAELATIELALENYKAKNGQYPYSHSWDWDKPNGYIYPPKNWKLVVSTQELDELVVTTNHLVGNQLYKHLVTEPMKAGKKSHLPNIKKRQYEGDSLLAPVAPMASLMDRLEVLLEMLKKKGAITKAEAAALFQETRRREKANEDPQKWLLHELVFGTWLLDRNVLTEAGANALRKEAPFVRFYYNSFDPKYNKDSYDLWVEYGDLGKDKDDPTDDTVRIISNWNK